MSRTDTKAQGVIRTLNVHQANGAIRSWRYNENAPWKRGGTERPFYLLVQPAGTAGHTEIELRTLREASLFCDGLASAHRAALAGRAAAENGKAVFDPAFAAAAGSIAHRLDQIEARLAAAHPKAARDGQLAAMLNDIRDSATCLGDPESSLYTG
jgi:hypothetical protein